MSPRFVLLVGERVVTVWDRRYERVAVRHVMLPSLPPPRAAVIRRLWLGRYRLTLCPSEHIAQILAELGGELVLPPDDEPIVQVRCSCPGTTHHPSCCLKGVDLHA